MRVELETVIAAPIEQVWEHVQTPALLHHIAHPLIRFEPVGRPWPHKWEPGQFGARMHLFGILPLGTQIIGIEMPDQAHNRRIVRDNGRGQLISKWDHWIFIEPDPNGTRYTDRIDIDAGLLTPFIVLFARLFYAHRQRRWRRLAATGFAPLSPV